jgi:hypothetical protein
MEIGRTSRTCLMGVADVQDKDGSIHRVSYTSQEQNDQIIVLVDPGQLDIRLSESSVRAIPNSQFALSILISRGQAITGDVQVELIVPEHIRGIEAPPLMIPAATDRGQLNLKFASLPTPVNMPLTIRATTTVNGYPYTAEKKIEMVPVGQGFGFAEKTGG